MATQKSKSLPDLRAELNTAASYLQDYEAFGGCGQASDGSLDVGWANRKIAALEAQLAVQKATETWRLADADVERLRRFVEGEIADARKVFEISEAQVPPVPPLASTAVADIEGHIANQEAYQTAIDSIAASRTAACARLVRVWNAIETALALLVAERQAADLPMPRHFLNAQTASGARLMAVPGSVAACDSVFAVFDEQRKPEPQNGLSPLELQIDDLRKAIKKKNAKVADQQLNDELWATDEELCRAAGHRGMTPAQYKREVRDAP